MSGAEVLCGIPVYTWLEVFFIAFAVKSVANVMKIVVIKSFRRKAFHYEIFKLVFIDGFMLGWLVYGNSIYFSKANDCDQIRDTRDLSELMGIMLFVGYLMMGMYILIMFSFPCLYYLMRQR
jgi:hypothetical protein